MRYGYGFGNHHAHHWMGMGWIMPLLWLIFLAALAFMAFRYLRHASPHVAGPALGSRETPEELLDRRFAAGEINAEEHAAARKHLRDHPR